MIKYIIIITFLLIFSSCKDEKKGDESTSAKVLSESVNLPKLNSWIFNDIKFDSISESEYYQNKSISYIETTNNGKPAYVAIDNIKLTDFGGLYEVSFLIKPTKSKSSFGFRIQEVYPNRLDVVFDLSNKTVTGLERVGDFTYNEKATIEIADHGFYKCTITTEIFSNYVRVLFGPTNDKSKVLTWESPISNNESVYFVSESLSFNYLVN
jgi:hypothetical protein